MKAQSIKHYRGTPLHEELLKIGKEITYTDWWLFVFPDSQRLGKILTGHIRPHQNRQLWEIDKEKKVFVKWRYQGGEI